MKLLLIECGEVKRWLLGENLRKKQWDASVNA